jgi:hypothetical protein
MEACTGRCQGAPTLVFGVLFAVSIFPVGPLLVQISQGDHDGDRLLPAFAAAFAPCRPFRHGD